MSPALYIALLALIRCGAVAVFVDPWISLRQIAAFAAFADPAGFIGTPASHLLRLFQSRLARLSLTVSSGPTFLGFPARLSLSQLMRGSESLPPVPVTSEAPALITFTSGSAGVPKGANRTHGFLAAQNRALQRELAARDDDVDMPMFPVFALCNLAAGITSVIPDMDFRRPASVDPQRISGQIMQNGVTTLTASPPFVDCLAAMGKELPLRAVRTGGAPVTHAQLQRWQQVFVKTEIDVLYGSTEAEPVARISCQERLATSERTGYCCGRPIPLLRCRTIKVRQGPVSGVELEGLICSQGEIGELIVAGAHVCRDYFNNPDAVRENKIIQPDGVCWHRMGDTGFFDQEGRFVLTGRVHSTIRRNGKLLHAQLVEAEAARRYPMARRIAAREQKGRLVLVVQGPPTPNAEALLDADKVVFTKKSLPVDPRHNAKIDYGRLRSLLDKGAL
jgi:acyl-CoA synthetase (AMP-forming)/AMP-acid ligase II